MTIQDKAGVLLQQSTGITEAGLVSPSKRTGGLPTPQTLQRAASWQHSAPSAQPENKSDLLQGQASKTCLSTWFLFPAVEWCVCHAMIKDMQHKAGSNVHLATQSSAGKVPCIIELGANRVLQDLTNSKPKYNKADMLAPAVMREALWRPPRKSVFWKLQLQILTHWQTSQRPTRCQPCTCTAPHSSVVISQI